VTSTEITISEGASRDSASSRPFGLRVSSTNSPVLKSTAASPRVIPGSLVVDLPASPLTRLPASTATIQLFREPGTQPSCMSAPGVTVSTTSRRTSPRATFGSSTCSQMATR
jgi:hypothetical protein